MTDLAPPTTASVDLGRPRRTPSWRARRPGLTLGVVGLAWGVGVIGTPLRSVGTAIGLAGLVAAASWSFAPTRLGRWLGAAGALFIPWIAIRHSPWLVTIDLTIASIALLAALLWRDRSSGGVATDPTAEPIGGPEVIVRQLRSDTGADDRLRRMATLARPLVAGVTVTAVVVGLLASGDAVFASYFDVAGVDTIAQRLLASCLGVVAALLLSIPAATTGVQRSERAPRARTPTIDVVMAGLTVSLIAYLAVQVSGAVLGEAFVRRRSGLTYAEWARSGFFQLIGVVAITCIVLARSAMTGRPTTVVRRAVPITLGLTVVGIVATSIVKLVVYTERFGLTMLRLHVVAAAIWLGVAAVVAAVASVMRRRRWVVPLLIGTLAAGVVGLNVMNPEAFVARTNLDRAIEQADAHLPPLDLDYLDRLSDDAAPTILERLDDVDVEHRERLVSRWCDERSVGEWRRWNRAEAQARAAILLHCD